MTSTSIHDYIQSLERELSAGNTTEHTHRPALKTLFQSLDPAITATNEPQHIIAVGAPDFRIIKNKLAIGYVECKDIGKNLDEVLETEQLKRYLLSFHNLLVTDYLEFRWYVKGDLRFKKAIGTLIKNKIKQDKESLPEVQQLLISFLNNEPEPIGSPKALVGHMARLADIMRDSTIRTLKNESVTGTLHSQFLAFRDNLIPDLSIEQFADMYAQTIAYGLFAARCETDNAKDFTRQHADFLIPKTNPFLRKLFNYIAGPDLDESITWAVDDLSQILAWADMEAVLKDFGKSTGKADPVVHFYETFLKEYDPKTRELRGVYYTPLPVVSYIVRSIDHVLKMSFDKPLGLADSSVLVLDPAVGTATFLYMVMQEIHEAVIKQGQGGIWEDYVAKKLLPRLFGFELLMAPYAIAHLKLGRLLKETGYQFQTDQRLQIYLTNTLGEGIAAPQQYYGLGHDLAVESGEANKIKREKPIVVVLGNPPYSGASANKGKWAKELVKRYYQADGAPLDEKNPKWLQDDYVKFLAFGQWRIEKTGSGILGFITNHSFLDNPTFRGMRQSLMNTFADIYIFNLHGNSKKKEVSPDGSKDENVFDIQQGVTIGIFIKQSSKLGPAKIHYTDLWGKREVKYAILSESDISTTEWTELNPSSPHYFFILRNETNIDEYMRGWKVTDIFPVNSIGIVTARDEFTIKWSAKEIENTIKDFVALPIEEARQKYRLGEDVRDWKISLAQKDLNDSGVLSENIVKILYRPFDIKYTYYTGHSRGFHCMPRGEVMRNMKNGGNLALITSRMTKGENYQHTLVSNTISEAILLSPRTSNNAFVFPLYINPFEKKEHIDKSGGQESAVQSVMVVQEKRQANLNPAFIKVISDQLGLKFVEEGKGDFLETFGPEDIFNYTYAVLHSTEYRSRYVEFLKIDFPRLPLTSDKVLFKLLSEKGSVLVSLHLMESSLLSLPMANYEVSGDHAVEKVSYDDKTYRLAINKTQYFDGVPPEVWDFHIGGYQVCEKWLKDRKGRKLTIDDIDHYQKILVSLKETIRLMSEIDETIEEHGGWPVAFD